MTIAMVPQKHNDYCHGNIVTQWLLPWYCSNTMTIAMVPQKHNDYCHGNIVTQWLLPWYRGNTMTIVMVTHISQNQEQFARSRSTA